MSRAKRFHRMFSTFPAANKCVVQCLKLCRCCIIAACWLVLTMEMSLHCQINDSCTSLVVVKDSNTKKVIAFLFVPFTDGRRDKWVDILQSDLIFLISADL